MTVGFVLGLSRSKNTSVTWIIDRTRQTAEAVEHGCLGAKTYHWVIDDPPFWKKLKEQK